MTSMKGEGRVGAAGCLAVTCLTWPSVGSGGLALVVWLGLLPVKEAMGFQ